MNLPPWALGILAIAGGLYLWPILRAQLSRFGL